MPTIEYLEDQQVRVGGVDFCYGMPPSMDGPASVLQVFKSRVLIEQLVDLVARVRPRRILELGIYRGGSVGLIACLCAPQKMVAVDLSDAPVERLTQFLDRQDLTATVVPYYGVDQADRARVSRILDTEFDTEPLDFVIDDASHLYGPSLHSFELIFPRLRAGGVYVIEDWATQHTLGATVVDRVIRRASGWERHAEQIAVSVDPIDPALAAEVRANPDRSTLVRASRCAAAAADAVPLSHLVLELVHLAAESADIVRRIEVTQGWIEVERGQGPVDSDGWFDASMDLFASLSRSQSSLPRPPLENL
jgi:predicted O-methyltransferase YrrM